MADAFACSRVEVGLMPMRLHSHPILRQFITHSPGSCMWLLETVILSLLVSKVQQEAGLSGSCCERGVVSFQVMILFFKARLAGSDTVLHFGQPAGDVLEKFGLRFFQFFFIAVFSHYFKVRLFQLKSQSLSFQFDCFYRSAAYSAKWVKYGISLV